MIKRFLAVVATGALLSCLWMAVSGAPDSENTANPDNSGGVCLSCW